MFFATVASLLMARKEAQTDVDTYKRLYDNARAQLTQIDRELQESYQGEQDRYTHEQIRQAREGILKAISGRMLHPWQIRERLPNLPEALIGRELRKLARDSRSGVYHNGKGTRARKYGRLRNTPK